MTAAAGDNSPPGGLPEETPGRPRRTRADDYAEANLDDTPAWFLTLSIMVSAVVLIGAVLVAAFYIGRASGVW